MKLEKSLICLRWGLVVGVLLLCGSEVSSQRFAGGMVAGFNASQIDGDDLAGYDKFGLTGGFKVIMQFESKVNLGVEFLYSERGSQPDVFNPEYDPDIKITLRYAEIPVYVTLGDWWQEEGKYFKMSAQAGLSYGRLISAQTYDYRNSGGPSYDELVPYFTENDLSWLLGVSWRMSQHWGLTGRYTRGIIPLLDPEKHNLQTNKLVSYFMSFRLEYYFK